MLVGPITSKYTYRTKLTTSVFCVLLLTNNGINVAVMITAKIIMTVSDNRCNVKLFLQSGNPQSVSKCFAKKAWRDYIYMEAQDGLKTIAPPLFLNIFFYFLLV